MIFVFMQVMLLTHEPVPSPSYALTQPHILSSRSSNREKWLLESRGVIGLRLYGLELDLDNTSERIHALPLPSSGYPNMSRQ